MIANPDGGGSIFWLEALKGEDAPVALKRTIVDASGKEVREEQIDGDVCGCCPTAVAKTSKGLLVAFRAHTKEDIRDIAVTRLENGKWSTPKIVNADDWEINACPTNAAAVAAQGRSRGGGLVYRRTGYAPRADGVFNRQRFQLSPSP